MATATITAEVTLSEYLDLMRARKGMTRADLASRLGVRRQALYDWQEKGWEIGADRIVQICSLLDLDPKIFFPKGE
jgi:transcriptional regulator with XRE-family HTH domain